MRRIVFLVFMMVLVGFQFALADEGMWLLDQLKDLPWKQMQQRGLQLTPEQVYHLKDAVVIIDGGTGEVVSPNGLILTNHHVAFGAIQRASSPETNYIRDGFMAHSREEEIPIPGYEVTFTVDFKDVTNEVLSVVKEGMSPLERYQVLARRRKELEDKYEDEKKHIEAEVVEMFSGMKYYLFLYKRYKDVRLVYAPPQSIGNYGGDIDNWMWPRHTGDFSFFRVYGDKKGNPAEYSKDNVPLKTKTYFPVSRAGVKEGDFTFIMGYPGRTYRYRSSYSIAYHQEVNYPFQIDLFRTAIQTLEEEAKQDPDVAIKVSGFIKGLNNGLKNNQGMLDGFRKLHLLEKKRKMEQELQAYIDSHPAMKEKYGNVLEEIGKLYADLRSYAQKRNMLRALSFASLPGAVYQAYRYAIEKEKEESQRDPAYSQKNIERTIERLKTRNDMFVPRVDRALMKVFLKKALELPAGQRLDFVDEIVQGKTGTDAESAIDAWVDNLYANSQFKDLASVIPLFQKSKKELEALHDPLIEYAQKYAAVMLPIETKGKEFTGAILALRPQYIRAIFEWKGGLLYPDANRTLRFTYGDVRGYSPRDAVLYLPKTSLKGVVEKNTGTPPFNAPPKLVELYNNKDYGLWKDAELNDVCVDFLHTTDITGGNSGSPVLNGKGELIGVAFDGNYEAMTSDYQYNIDLTRTISVDSRYVMFILEKFSQADYVLKELKVVK